MYTEEEYETTSIELLVCFFHLKCIEISVDIITGKKTQGRNSAKTRHSMNFCFFDHVNMKVIQQLQFEQDQSSSLKKHTRRDERLYIRTIEHVKSFMLPTSSDRGWGALQIKNVFEYVILTF